jgi:hypothetical protein
MGSEEQLPRIGDMETPPGIGHTDVYGIGHMDVLSKSY